MKRRMIAVGAAFAAVTATASHAAPAAKSHLELDMTSAEYRQLLDQRSELEASGGDLQPALDAGKRLLDWLEVINAQRAADKKLELSTPATQRGIPITAPREYNHDSVKKDFDDALAGLTDEMRNVLTGTGTLPATIGTDDAAFLEKARLLDRAYQNVSRWLLMEPYLDYLAGESVNDVRGYYYLTREPDLEAKLNGWGSLSADVKAKLTDWLVGLCHNSNEELASCSSSLTSAARSNTVKAFYNRYLPASKKLWDGFFELAGQRPDVDWTSSDPKVMKVPFVTPSDSVIKSWLSDNIEDEWRLGDWQLRLAFQATGGSEVPHLEFQAGTTPHVNGIAGNVITMDANRSVAEYTSRWTIRHEYGHVLGFPDCYVEYYDEAKGVIINYQLDIQNLMCSRVGHLQQLHVDELRKAYFKN